MTNDRRKFLMGASIAASGAAILGSTTAHAQSLSNTHIVSDYEELELLAPSVGDIIKVTNSGIAGDFVVESGSALGDGGITLNFTSDNSIHARRLYESVINIKWFGATGNGSTDDSDAIQRAFDYLPQYSTDTQNSGSFQEKIELYFPDGDYILKKGVVKRYRNSWRISGSGRLKAHNEFSDSYLMELIACSHLEIIGIQFDGNNYVASSALRISGDGDTGSKRNSTNIKLKNCFFYHFGKDNSDSYVIDTLSPNNIFGDYSIDDSSFIECNWLGARGGAIRLASSEIKIDGGKMSFVGVDGITPAIFLGNGTSMMLSDMVFTNCYSKHIGVADNASIGRVKIDGCYNEGTDKPLYSHSGGVVRSLEVTGGYFAGYDDSNSTFIEFTNKCKGQLSISSVAFQSNGYTKIDLGESGSCVGDMQTATTSYKSYYPKIINGVFRQDSMFIQTTQDNDKKRSLDAKYDQICDTKLQLFVGNVEDFTRLRFTSLKDALKYVDQSGYTECEVQVPAGDYLIDIPFVFSGEVNIVCAGPTNTTINISSPVIVKSGILSITSANIRYVHQSVHNKNSTVEFVACTLSSANNSNSDFLINHYSGTTVFSSCDFELEGSCAYLNNAYRSTGSIYFNNTSFSNTDAVTSNTVTAMCRTIFVGTKPPTEGYWQRGSIMEASQVNSGQTLQEICTYAGSPGAWRGTIHTDSQ